MSVVLASLPAFSLAPVAPASPENVVEHVVAFLKRFLFLKQPRRFVKS